MGNGTRMAELKEWQEQRLQSERQIEEISSLVAELERAKEAALATSAEALIAREPSDLSLFRELDDRLTQARHALRLLQARYTVNGERFGPTLTYRVPPLYTRHP